MAWQLNKYNVKRKKKSMDKQGKASKRKDLS